MTSLRYLLSIVLISAACGAENERKSSVSIVVNGLEAELKVLQARIKSAQEFAVQVVLKNRSNANLRLNTLHLDHPRVLLEVRHINGLPVHAGPPGIPPQDDGEVGRKILKPGEFVFYKYTGSDYFGSSLVPGIYQVRFTFDTTLPQHGDWTGNIETEWLEFEVIKPSLPGTR
jgi:hypothetical protein